MNLFLASEVASAAEQISSSTSNPQETISTFDRILSDIVHWCATSGLRLVFGVIILFILFKVVNRFALGFKHGMEKRNSDATITRVVYNLIKKGLKIVLFVLFLGFIGVNTAGIGSIIASCAVAIGLALQGSLSNIAGWVIIILMKPFKLGHYIMCQGVEGTVEDIQLFYTYLKTPDNKVIMVPNGALANGNITNFSTKETRRVDLQYQISYSADIVNAINVIKEVISKHEEILKDPEPFVRLSNCDASAIVITSRVWVKQENYWNVYFDLLQEVKDAFDAHDIEIPFNQLDVTIKNKEISITNKKED